MDGFKYIHHTAVHSVTAANAFVPILLLHIQSASIDLEIKDLIGIDGFNVDIIALLIL